jgi:hypothetical protein
MAEQAWAANSWADNSWALGTWGDDPLLGGWVVQPPVDVVWVEQEPDDA